MYKNKIMLILLIVSIATMQAFAFSTSQATVNSKSKILSIKTEMNDCIKIAESKVAIHNCLDNANSSLKTHTYKK